ncbi:TonB-dependent receptor plug domain-containing protein [Pseudoalteromonas piscicida]|uniref:TonB-dependent receptor n=1 Tax=Pseudoalteromonas piscicida TaxID=43662 RepID=A0AAD0W5E1_PSEO7|nr:TonB-dependent receptor [Pseudoalteromonas piscicida]ASD69173.1 hypothetical protein B1L02_19920 [Pseudoalteromonas piscicida]AXR04460.1 hypothetical protein D0511_21390 [Pseudoalteromonas piscicida]
MTTIMYKHSLIAAAVLSAVATNSVTAATDEQVEEIERVEVTGSRIKRIAIEGVTNVQSLSSADMVRSGFNTVYDALSSISAASGAVLGEVETGSYTPGAKELNLLGVGPEYTLILVNGKRLAYYPMPYGGQTNFVNLDMLPTAMVERIDIQSGGGSAIYGSDAMAGVVNIITKKGMDEHVVEAFYGQDTYGTGDKKGLSFVGGFEQDDFTFDYSLEYKTEEALTGADRPFHDSVWDNPDPTNKRELNRSITVWAENTEFKNQYSAQYCNTDNNPHPTAVQHFISRNDYGLSCGWDETGNNLLRNQVETMSLYINSVYSINDEHSFFVNGFYIDQEKKGARNPFFFAHAESIHGSMFWDPDIKNNAGGYGAPVKYMWRIVNDSEYTDDGLGRVYDDKSYSYSFGLEGEIADYYYSVGFSRSQYDFSDRYLHHTVEGNNWLKGPKLGEVDGMPIYRPNYQAFFAPLTQDNMYNMADWATYDGLSFNETLTADLSGDLFELPAGFVSFAAYIELMKEGTRATPDSRILNKEFVGLTGVITDGERNRYAAATEFMIPITEQISSEIALRYDHYDDISDVGGAFTYQVGFKYSPTDALMLRSAYGTTFRGPSMSSVYQGFAGNFGRGSDRVIADACLRFQTTGDPAQYNADALTISCADLDTTNINEPKLNADYETISAGDPTLKEESGHSLTFGLVYEYSPELSFNVDVYDIVLKDKITRLGSGEILDNVWKCENGLIDPSSAKCANMQDRVQRFDQDGLATDWLGNTKKGLPYTAAIIREGYINAAERQHGGVNFGVKGTLESELGEFIYKLDYSHVLKKKEKLRPEDPLADVLDSQDNYNFKDMASFNLTWQLEKTAISWQVNYKGKNWNGADFGQREKLPAWIKHNLTVGHYINDNTRVMFTVQNLLNAMPPQDDSFRSYPFYKAGNYDTNGREFLIKVNYQF